MNSEIMNEVERMSEYLRRYQKAIRMKMKTFLLSYIFFFGILMN